MLQYCSILNIFLFVLLKVLPNSKLKPYLSLPTLVLCPVCSSFVVPVVRSIKLKPLLVCKPQARPDPTRPAQGKFAPLFINLALFTYVQTSWSLVPTCI